MNIQIFGTTKCFDTKKAQRYFKERGIKFQMIDLKEKEMSRGEFENVARALGGWEKLVNPQAKDKQTLALLDALFDPHRPQRQKGHRGLPARHLEGLGVSFHKNSTARVLRSGAECGILGSGARAKTRAPTKMKHLWRRCNL